MSTQLTWVFTISMMMTTAIHAQTVKSMKDQMTKEEQKVLNVVTRMTAAFQSKDIDEVMACYEPQALVAFEPGAPVTDNKLLREMFSGMAMSNPVFTYSGHEVFVAGDLATHIAPWQMTVTAPDGSVIEQSGLSVAVLRKQEDGQWLMVLDNPHGQNLLNK